jgi:enoyl-CoA hydratase/carnithine racemase
MARGNSAGAGERVEDRGVANCRIEGRDQGEVAWVTLEHRGKRNAIGSAMIADLTTIFSELGERRDLRVVVLTGAGSRAFVGGAFLPELHALDAESGRAFITRLHLLHQAVRDCPLQRRRRSRHGLSGNRLRDRRD